MTQDPHIVLPATLMVLALACLGWMPIWLQNPRRKTIMLAFAATTIFILGLLGRVMLPFLPAIIAGNSALVIVYGLIWSACREFRGKRVRIGWILAPAAAWSTLCFLPAFQASGNMRLFVSGLMLLVPLALSIREIIRIRQGSAVVRAWTLAILGIQAALVLGRSVWALALPQMAARTFWSIPGITLMMLECAAFALLLAPGLVALEKELSDLRHRDTALSDHLTGVANRRYFEEALHRHARRSARQGHPLSLVMADADHFKDYNDFYGHLAGDKCLHILAQTLTKACRPGDLVTRYGGEEFAILLPNTAPEIAHAVARRMLIRVRDLRLPHGARPEAFVTLSLGVATMLPTSDETAPSNLIEAADQALYRAKREGRDRVCVDGEDLPRLKEA